LLQTFFNKIRDLLIISSSTLATLSTLSDATPASSIAPPQLGPPQVEQRTPPHFSSHVPSLASEIVVSFEIKEELANLHHKEAY